MIGSIETTIQEKQIPSSGSMAIFTGIVKDPIGNILLRKSDIKSVDIAVMERVVEAGIQRFEPKEIPWRCLLLDEYDLFDEPQPKGNISSVDYTFRYQPSGDRWPMFPYGGLFEVWFRFRRKTDGEDDIRMIFTVRVGNTSGPRRIE